MKIFKKNHDSVEYLINFVAMIMLGISAIITINLYAEDGNGIISIGIFGGMGLTMELAKIIFILLLGFFILKRMTKESIITGILCIVLLGISVYANYTYSINLDSRKLESGKIETQEYKRLASQKSKLEKELNKLNNSKNDKEKKSNNYDTQINEQVRLKDETIAKYDDVWSKNNTAKQYNAEIERLTSDKNSTNTSLKDIDNKINEVNKKLTIINNKLNVTTQYKYNKNKGVNSNTIRVVLGIMFEIIAVSLFFLGIIRKNTLIKEKNGIKTPQEIFENAVNELIINVTTAYTEQIKSQTRLFSQQFNNPSQIYDAEVKQIEEKGIEDLEQEPKKLFTKRPLPIENIKAYHDFIVKNSDDDNIAIGYKKVAEKLGISEGEALRIYKTLRDKGYLITENKQTIIEKEYFNENDFIDKV
jgi:DNA-binding Lrp family transcriptional regulator